MLTLDQTLTILDASRRKADALGIVVATCVLDEHGQVIATARMDGCRFHLMDMAKGKAFLSAAQQRPSRRQDGFFGGSPIVAGGLMVGLVGGYPVRRDGEVVAAIGVAGSTDENDEACAIAGIEAIPGLTLQLS